MDIEKGSFKWGSSLGYIYFSLFVVMATKRQKSKVHNLQHVKYSYDKNLITNRAINGTSLLYILSICCHRIHRWSNGKHTVS